MFDGLNPIVATRMNSMNYRFASPGGLVGLYELGNDGINWWSDYDDTVRGQGKPRPAGPLPEANDRCPKIAEILGSAEFWDLRASADFVGTDAEGRYPAARQCAALLQCRRHHNGGRGGFDLVTPPIAACVLSSNPNPASDTNRAVFAALVDWVTKGTEPPRQHISDLGVRRD